MEEHERRPTWTNGPDPESILAFSAKVRGIALLTCAVARNTCARSLALRQERFERPRPPDGPPSS